MTEQSSSSRKLRIRPWGLLTAAGVVASVATVLGFFGRHSWFLDLFSHFRLQYILGLVGVGVLLLIGHRRKTAAVFLILAGVNLVPVLPLYFGKPGNPDKATPALRAMLINVNSRLGDAERLRAVVSTHDPDILVLEEIDYHWTLDLASLTNSYPHKIVKHRADNFGIGLFSKLPLSGARIVYIGDAEVPSIIATANTAETNLCVIATHPLPPGGRAYSRWRNGQLEQLPNFIPSDIPVLLLGDLNVTPWNHYFRRLLERTDLRDSMKGFGVQSSWPSYNLLFRIPIDHCLHSADIVILDRKIGESVSSDHYPVIVDFAIGN